MSFSVNPLSTECYLKAVFLTDHVFVRAVNNSLLIVSAFVIVVYFKTDRKEKYFLRALEIDNTQSDFFRDI